VSGAPAERTDTLWTIGHWNLAPEAFLAPLRATGIELLVDVRSLPGSRHSPQFNQEEMQRWLGDAAVDYAHLAELGGRRRALGVDRAVNAGWQNASFHHYADYALSDTYLDGIERLEDLACNRPSVIMCGEPVPWRCHRSLIADTLVVRGWNVVHLMAHAAPIRHELGRWGATPLVGNDGRVTYPAS